MDDAHWLQIAHTLSDVTAKDNKETQFEVVFPKKYVEQIGVTPDSQTIVAS